MSHSRRIFEFRSGYLDRGFKYAEHDSGFFINFNNEISGLLIHKKMGNGPFLLIAPILICIL